MDRRNGVLYAGAGRHYPQYRAAGDRPKPGAFAAGDAIGRHQLHADGSDADPGQRLAGGPLRHPARVHLRRHVIHPRLAAVRSVPYAERAGSLSRAAGHRRRDDDAGRAIGATARLPTQRTAAGAELRHHARPGRADSGAAAGRLAGHLRHLALDFPDQYPYRPARHLLCA